ncbi:alkaline phosphatase D family protein [Pseudoxanthomonas kalamensis]|uniref:alkaline phosphatase D family protein n=1 Tax=Pseudoxanthomonas kalamensis TaxID=289483 RepID=UPI00139174AC|nr:alkaline phosphatase D family protein [Pseudoxanthomonas kalamensis]
MKKHHRPPRQAVPGDLVSLQRRQLFKTVISAGLLACVEPARTASRLVLFPDYPFKLGVASGTPSADGFVLWTRLCPDPLHDGGMGVMQVPLRWEVATDEHFGNVVRSGRWYAMAGLAHSAHVPVTGLAPDRWYWYRFIAGNEVSPVGRTRTLPAAGAEVDRLRFALASCQHFEMGYFSSYRHMLRDDPDMVCFVGDYIYEYNASDRRVRVHAHPEPYSLQEYRARYAQYKLDPDLQAMHQAVPWMLTIDDHEVMNDWGGERGEDYDPNFPERRANALQAYFEHQPLPMGALLPDRRLQLYRGFQIGRLARFHVLDDRQYRDPMVCPRPGMAGSRFDVTDATCAQRLDPKRSILGHTQETWLDKQFAASKERWNVIMQQSLVSPLPTPSDEGSEFFTDAWDGYPKARDRMVSGLQHHRVRNPLIIGGDYHCTIACDVKADYARPESAIIGTEFVGTSLTSPSMSQAVLDAKIAANPHAHYGDSTRRGYLMFDMRPSGVEVEVRNPESVTVHDSACATTRKFRVEDGRPGVMSA